MFICVHAGLRGRYGRPPRKPCRIIEIGAYRVRDGRVADEFQTLINPEMPIPEFITRLTGISNEMVANAPVFSDVVHDLLSFIGDSILVAHNSGFDMGFLNYEIGRVFEEYRVANPCLCTVMGSAAQDDALCRASHASSARAGCRRC